MESLMDRPAHVPENRVIDFDIYDFSGATLDYHGAWKTLQDSGIPSIVWTPRNDGHWMVTRGELMTRVLNDYQNFSSRIVFVPRVAFGEAFRALPITLDPPEHAKFRNLLSGGLGPKKVNELKARIRQLACEMIDELLGRGECNFTVEYAEQFPVRIFMAIMDLPITDAPMLKRLIGHLTRPDGSMSRDAAVAQLHEYMAPRLMERVGQSGTDLITHLANAEIDGEKLRLKDMLDLTVNTLGAGIDTTAAHMGFAMHFLATHPERRAELAHNPGMIPDAVEEMLRRFPPAMTAREVKNDVVIEGAFLKQSDVVLLPTHLAGLDELQHPNPMEVDFHRPSTDHISFGSGIHRCVGASLARAEIAITFEEWLKRIPNFEMSPGHAVSFTPGWVPNLNELMLRWDVALTNPQ